MDEVFESRVTLPPGTLRSLSERADGPTVRAAAALFTALSLGIVAIAVGQTSMGVLVSGVAIGGCFPPFHEALHRTALRSPRANDAFAAITGFFQVASPTAYRAFHFSHHRLTHLPGDPELGGAPALLANWPAPWLVPGFLTGAHIFVGKLFLLVAYAALPRAIWAGVAPYVTPEIRWRVAAEAWAVGLGHAALVAWLGPAWFAALALGHLCMGPWLCAEHTGLPMTGTVLERTRSHRTSAWFAAYWWNMNYHAEHHAWPSVPWWQLPALADRIEDRLPNVGRYADTFRGAMR